MNTSETVLLWLNNEYGLYTQAQELNSPKEFESAFGYNSAIQDMNARDWSSVDWTQVYEDFTDE